MFANYTEKKIYSFPLNTFRTVSNLTNRHRYDYKCIFPQKNVN